MECSGFEIQTENKWVRSARREIFYIIAILVRICNDTIRMNAKICPDTCESIYHWVQKGARNYAVNFYASLSIYLRHLQRQQKVFGKTLCVITFEGVETCACVLLNVQKVNTLFAFSSVNVLLSDLILHDSHG